MPFVFLHVLPIAVAIALEPVCVLAALVMTATDRPLADSLAYLGALAGVMLGYGVVVLLALQHHAVAGGSAVDDVIQTLWLLIGLGFLAAFGVLLAHRPHASAEQREAVWTRRITATGPLGAAAVGVFLVNWEMETPALTVILKSRVSTADALITLVLFCAVALSTSTVPLLAYLAAPGGVGGTLDRAKSWLGRHERPIMLALFLIIGVAFTWVGGAALLRR
jgi:hypothetical protein